MFIQSLFHVSLALLILISCGESKQDELHNQTTNNTDVIDLSISLTRIPAAGLDPFRVNVTIKRNQEIVNNVDLVPSLSRGNMGAVAQGNDGVYSFQVTPSSTGEHKITISYGGVTITRTAIVLDSYSSETSQPMSVPGDDVNSIAYEDGATITPDGEYLFVQYGPFHFSGILNYLTICSSGVLSAGYDLNTCHGRPNNSLIFESIGPLSGTKRPDFPGESVVNGKLVHLPTLISPTNFNGLVGFPTTFYGFKRQSDGTFSEAFQFGLNDPKGLNGPFGPSFKLNTDGTIDFIIAWNNPLNLLGDDKADIYYGTLDLETKASLADVSYTTTGYDSISNMTISELPFTSHSGNQGNPHMYYNESNVVTSVWVDDEVDTKDLAVYRVAAGAYPTATWLRENLPSKINTVHEESQPVFNGDKLFLRRDTNIVSHSYSPANGACSNTYTHNDCWGDELIVIGANGNTGVNEIFTVGEPSLSVRDGKTYLYFVYVQRVENSILTGGILDWNSNVGFVEL